MRNQINRYARGVFEYNPPVLELKDNSIYGVADRMNGFEGVLRFGERQGQKLRGVVYSDNDKVCIGQQSFSGSDIEISYTVNCDRASEGDIIDGNFYIVSNGGEGTVPFSFRVGTVSFGSSAGPVKNLFGFAELAQGNEAEAIKIFQDKGFENAFLGDDLTLRSVYQTLNKGNDARLGMEEFLIAANKKKPVGISLSGSSAVFEGVRETFKDTITVEKDTWGFVDINVSVRSDFLVIERNEITSDMFAGNKYEFEYIVNYENMHNGVNFGEIIFSVPGKKITYTVRAVKNRASSVSPQRHALRNADIELMNIYLKFRTHSITMSDWIRETGIVIENVRSIDDSRPFYRLMLAHTYIAGGNDPKAKELMESVKDEISSENKEDYPLYCYFLYVNSLYMRDRAYSRKAAASVNNCYREYKDWRILWILLFLDEELEANKSIKLLRIKEQFNKGCSSPAMYLEACNILNEQPELLRMLNSFEINVLTFGARNGILDGTLISEAAEMTMNVRKGGENYIRLLEALYEADDDTVILESLCKMLIRSGKVGPAYLKYYGDGIARELKITQLFEYYIMSRSKDDMTPMPKMLLMYFGYNNRLDYQNKAYLFANIIYNKESNIQIYKSYIPQIESFVQEQIIQGHINRHLAYIYNHFVTPAMITAENAEAVSELYFTYRVSCSLPGMRGTVIRHKESRSEREYPVSNGESYVKIYTDDPAIVFTDASGNRYAGREIYTIQRMLEDDAILGRCAEMNPELIHIKLANCEKYIRCQKKTIEAVDSLIEMADMPEMNAIYHSKLISTVIQYYYDGYDAEGFDKFISEVNEDELSGGDLCRIIEIYIIQGRCAEAFELIKKHSAMSIIPKRLLKLCSRLDEDDSENSEELVFCNWLCFSRGKYDEVTLDFLSRNYNGTTSQMVSLWKKASAGDIDTYDLEERIIAQTLFTRSAVKNINEIFESYYSKGPNHRTVEAYLAYYSYDYFVRQNDIAETVFDIMEAVLENDEILPVVCKMAIVKYYSELDNLSRFRSDLAQTIIQELVRKSYIFPFFEKFNGKISLPQEVLDKKMVEYRTDPSHRVIIRYIFEDKEHRKSYVAEDMKNVYEGIFVKSFVLFYGESLRYYISEETGDGEIVTESVLIEKSGINQEKTQGRYEAINDIIASRDAHDGETMKKLAHSYAVGECVVEQMFKPL